jgi:hypothetical protein
VKGTPFRDCVATAFAIYQWNKTDAQNSRTSRAAAAMKLARRVPGPQAAPVLRGLGWLSAG